MTVWPFAAAALLLAANAFFVAMEFAVIGSRRSRLEPLADAGNVRAARGLEAVSNLNRELGGAQLGITMASLGLGLVAEPAVARLLTGVFELTGISEALAHTIAIVVALAIVVFLHLVVAEMVPKNLALVDPEKMLMRWGWLDRAYLFVFGPVVHVLTWLANGCLYLLRVQPRSELGMAHTAEELAVMLAASHDEGVIEDFAAELMAGVLDFGGQVAGSIMVARDRIAYIRRSTTVAEAERLVVASGHSRLPVVGRDLDDVLGFIHAKDLLTLPPEAADRPVPMTLVRRMMVAPVGRSLEDLLLGMRRVRVHFAVVHDEVGTVGIVTLEDLLEELVGDILDESDPVRPPPPGKPQ